MKYAFAVLTLGVSLDEFLRRIPIGASHWIQDRMGIREGMHDFLHGFCPCQTDLEIEQDEPSVA